MESRIRRNMMKVLFAAVFLCLISLYGCEDCASMDTVRYVEMPNCQPCDRNSQCTSQNCQTLLFAKVKKFCVDSPKKYLSAQELCDFCPQHCGAKELCDETTDRYSCKSLTSVETPDGKEFCVSKEWIWDYFCTACPNVDYCKQVPTAPNGFTVEQAALMFSFNGKYVGELFFEANKKGELTEELICDNQDFPILHFEKGWFYTHLLRGADYNVIEGQVVGADRINEMGLIKLQLAPIQPGRNAPDIRKKRTLLVRVHADQKGLVEFDGVKYYKDTKGDAVEKIMKVNRQGCGLLKNKPD